MADTLFAPTQAAEGLYKDRGSRFLAFSEPVTTQTDIAETLTVFKKRFHDARHHCYAYRLGMYGDTVFANDDGEPAHSAGDPILGAIRSQSLTNVLVVVVRYFGGTKLGVRGLIEAYRSAAEAALEAVAPVELVPKVTFLIRFSYEQTSEVNRILHPHVTEELEATYEVSVQQTLAIRKEDFPPLQAQLNAANLDWDLLQVD